MSGDNFARQTLPLARLHLGRHTGGGGNQLKLRWKKNTSITQVSPGRVCLLSIYNMRFTALSRVDKTLDMVVRYTRSVTFDVSLKVYESAMKD